MREILFRGKRDDNGELVEGLFLPTKRGEATYIIPKQSVRRGTLTMRGHLRPEFIFYDVDPDTVSEFTGLCDKKGKRIFEGDIVAVPCDRRGNEYIGVVEFGEMPNGDDRYTGFYIKWNNPDIVGSVRCSLLWWRDTKDRYLKVIGNKWDNPELLEG